RRPVAPAPSRPGRRARRRPAARCPAPPPDTTPESSPDGQARGSLDTLLFAAFVMLHHAALLQRLSHLRRHVILIVLGQHFIGYARAIGIGPTQRNDALAFTEQVRKDALEADGDRFDAIGDAEADAE